MTRNDIDRRVIETAIKADGAVSRSQLVGLGISETAIDRRLRSGILERVIAGYYVVPLVRSPTSAAAAILLAHPHGALSHATAAERFGFPIQPPEQVATAHVIIAHGASLHPPGVVVHETRRLPDVDVVTVDGWRVTSPARTICDLAPELSGPRLVHLLETQLSAQRPDPEDLIACCEARSRRGVRGMVRLAQAVNELVDSEPFPESVLEIGVLGGLEKLGLVGLRRQFRPPWYNGVRGIVDAADPAGRTIVECDGRRFRQVTQSHDDDRQRDRIAASYGWATVRVGWREFTRDRDRILTELADVILSRRDVASIGTTHADTVRNRRSTPPRTVA